MPNYDQSWHQKYSNKTEESARRVLRHVVDTFGPASLLEVGCGLGHWTKAAIELGVKDVIGVDGPWTSPADLVIPSERFVVADLERPLRLGRRFDVVLALEVAEHLDGSAADIFVESLVHHSDLVIFGAAIPLQGGFKHINEQWPSYWATLFSHQDFRAFDFIRPIFWNDTSIHYWYRQNTIVFIKNTRLDLIKIAAAELLNVTIDCTPIDMVHPEKFQATASYEIINMRRLLPRLPRAIWRLVERRIFRVWCGNRVPL